MAPRDRLASYMSQHVKLMRGEGLFELVEGGKWQDSPSDTDWVTERRSFGGRISTTKQFKALYVSHKSHSDAHKSDFLLQN